MLITRKKYYEKLKEDERIVFETVQRYLDEKKGDYHKEGDQWERKKLKELSELDEKIQQISQQKQEDEDLKAKLTEEVDAGNLALDLKRKQEEEKEAELERKRQDKIAQNEAAKYVQNKWIWYKDVGKNLRKKKKRRGGKKKKK